MRRMPRVEYAGAIYHVTVRMAGHAWETGRDLNPSVCLFRDDAERARFVEGKAKPPPWLTCGPILAFCGGRPAEQRREYRRFVENAVGESEEEDQATFRTSALAIGGDAFVDWVRGKLIERGQSAKCTADTSLRPESADVPVDHVLAVAAQMLDVAPGAFKERRRDSDLRGIAARVLCRFAGLTQREAAGVLGVKTGAAVGQQLARLRQRLQADAHLRRRLADIEETLAQDC